MGPSSSGSATKAQMSAFAALEAKLNKKNGVKVDSTPVKKRLRTILVPKGPPREPLP